MKFEDIDLFLKIIKYGNMAKAAQVLYIGQGTVSTRIQQLEEELGITLFYRRKGIKEVILTPEGESFLPIAQQWMALKIDADNIKNRNYRYKLSVVAAEPINVFIIKEFYKDFMNNNRNIQLIIQSAHSKEINYLIENQISDIGISFDLIDSKHIVSQILYTEKLVIVCHKKSLNAKANSILELNKKSEVYVPWFSEYVIWHTNFFPSDFQIGIEVGSSFMLESFLEDDNNAWGIVPEMIAKKLLEHNSSLMIHHMEDIPLQRTAYLITHKYMRPSIEHILDIFVKDIRNYIGLY